MKRLDILLILVLGRHKLHVWLAHSGTDRPGVVSAVLLIFDEGLYILRCNDPDHVAELLKLTLSEESAGASLDPDHTGQKLRQYRQKLIPPQALANHQPTLTLSPLQLEHAFRQIDTHECNRHLLLPYWLQHSAFVTVGERDVHPTIWLAQYGGMDAALISQMKAIEDENCRLKRMYADLSMQNDLLKEGFGVDGGDGEVGDLHGWLFWWAGYTGFAGLPKRGSCVRGVKGAAWGQISGRFS